MDALAGHRPVNLPSAGVLRVSVVGEMDPDWDALREIAAEAGQESAKPGWNDAKWKALLEQAVEATNGHPQFTEFMTNYMPRDDDDSAR